MTTLSALSPDLLTNEEAAALLGIKPNTLEIWRTKGKGPEFVKLGRTKSAPIRYLRSKIFEWLECQSFSSTSAYAPNAKQAV
ncbi:MAG: helix-turn-helix domain-containing protein [Pseudomonadota bacterium]|nr:helix-turn-helix domain-containing protein [Pseudomonadota bacterium]